jgi:hypothetical protein
MMQLQLLLVAGLLSVGGSWWLWDDTADTADATASEAVASDPLPVISDSLLAALANVTEEVISPPVASERTASDAIAADVTEATLPAEDVLLRLHEKMVEVIAAHGEGGLYRGGEKHVNEGGQHNPEFDHQVGGGRGGLKPFMMTVCEG